MNQKYSDCYFCGGEVREQRIPRELWWQGTLYLVTDVPVGVCGQCGQKVILPEVARLIDQMLVGQTLPDEFARVPTYRFPEAGRVA